MALGNPDVLGRCDLYPMLTWWERFRFYAIEFIFLAVLASGALNTSDSKKVSGWLNTWALFAYCFHVAFARVLPVPYGAVVTVAFIPIFFLMLRNGGGKGASR